MPSAEAVKGCKISGLAGVSVVHIVLAKEFFDGRADNIGHAECAAGH